MYLRFKGGKQHAVTLSYDDGVVFDIRLIEIMTKYGLKGTFNINSGMYLPEDAERTQWKGRLKRSEALELYSKPGIEVGVHSLTHPYLDQLRECEIVHEITEDRRNLEKDFGMPINGMAYPMGTYDSRVVDVLKNCGIAYSRTVKTTESFRLPENWLTLHPTCHHNNPKLMELAKSFTEDNRQKPPKLFYLWGHSYEFNNDDNWNVIEDFAGYIGNRQDVWYATNIEIFNYVKAYKSLITSYDQKIIHNPTAIDIWIYHDGETLMIKSGETLLR